MDYTTTDDVFSVSYVSSPIATTSTTSTAYQFRGVSSPLQQLTTAAYGAFGGLWPGGVGTSAVPVPSSIIQGGQEKVMARLVRFTVVDPNPQLAKVKPEISILMSGTVMLDGIDDRGFIMDLAPKVAEVLPKHNEELSMLMWENEKGESKPFRPVKLSNLDVVVESLKSY